MQCPRFARKNQQAAVIVFQGEYVNGFVQLQLLHANNKADDLSFATFPSKSDSARVASSRGALRLEVHRDFVWICKLRP